MEKIKLIAFFIALKAAFNKWGPIKIRTHVDG